MPLFYSEASYRSWKNCILFLRRVLQKEIIAPRKQRKVSPYNNQGQIYPSYRVAALILQYLVGVKSDTDFVQYISCTIDFFSSPEIPKLKIKNSFLVVTCPCTFKPFVHFLSTELCVYQSKWIKNMTIRVLCLFIH